MIGDVTYENQGILKSSQRIFDTLVNNESSKNILNDGQNILNDGKKIFDKTLSDATEIYNDQDIISEEFLNDAGEVLKSVQEIITKLLNNGLSAEAEDFFMKLLEPYIKNIVEFLESQSSSANPIIKQVENVL